MKKHIKFPSIEQFRNVVANVNRTFNFIGLDENGEAIYDETKPKPVITFTGTVKLHGTNASVCYNELSGMWGQSRENIVTIEKDNAGFAWFVDVNKEAFAELFEQVKQKEQVDLTKNTISIFGEWCGGNIQKGVGIANLEKSFFIFGVKISPIIDVTTEQDKLDRKELVANWVDYTYLRKGTNKIYNVSDYQTWSIDIDFNIPQLKQNELSDLTIAVEQSCPIATAFGFPNQIGEGIVWVGQCNDSRLIFKVKGELHSSSKVKTLAPVNVEKLNGIVEFTDSVVTESRLNQALENVFPNNEPLDIKKTGDVIRWVVTDVMKEELDTMKANNIEPKDVNAYVSKKTKDMFMKVLSNLSK